MNSDVMMILQIVRQSKLQQVSSPPAAADAAFSSQPARSQSVDSSQVTELKLVIQLASVQKLFIMSCSYTLSVYFAECLMLKLEIKSSKYKFIICFYRAMHYVHSVHSALLLS